MQSIDYILIYFTDENEQSYCSLLCDVILLAEVAALVFWPQYSIGTDIVINKLSLKQEQNEILLITLHTDMLQSPLTDLVGEQSFPLCII